MNDIKNVCVYSASSTKIAKVYFDVAEELGRLLAEKKINLINGAGCIGLMAATSDAALAAGGTVTGVIPHFMVEQGWHHTGLTRLIETETMHERKRMMADLSDGVIALPGGCGTLEELLEIITWKQLGLYLNPIIILNINGFYNPLLEMLQRAVEVLPGDTPEVLQRRVMEQAEWVILPKAIDLIANGKVSVEDGHVIIAKE